MIRRFQFGLKSLFFGVVVFAPAFWLGMGSGRRREREQLEADRQRLEKWQANLEAREADVQDWMVYRMMEKDGYRVPDLSPSIGALPER